MPGASPASWQALREAAEESLREEDFARACELYADAAYVAHSAVDAGAPLAARLHGERSAALQRLRSWKEAARAAERAVDIDRGYAEGS